MDSSDDEPSSGYQTSDLKSPQSKIRKNSKIKIDIPNTCIVVHCQDQERNNTLFCWTDLSWEKIVSDKNTTMKNGSLGIKNMNFYSNGEIFNVSEGLSILLRQDSGKDVNSQGSVSLSSVKIHVNQRLLKV